MRDTTAWESTKERVLTRWPALTEDDVEPTEGRRDELVALLEGRLGYAHANAVHDIDQVLEGDVVVPRDVADEFNHTGTTTNAEAGPFSSTRQYADDRADDETKRAGATAFSSPKPYGTDAAEELNRTGGAAPAYGDAFSSRPYVNDGSFAADAFNTNSQRSAGWDGNTMREATFNEAIHTEMAWPWRKTAAIAAAIGTLGVTFALRARRKSQRKHLVIPLPTQAESAQAAEVVGHAASSGWKYLRSLTVLLVGGIAGWGVRRYQAM